MTQPATAEANAEHTKAVAEHSARVAKEGKTRELTKRAFYALQGEPIGLSMVGASMLCAHLFASEPNPEKMTAKAVAEWAHNFRHQNPVVWSALLRGHVPQFVSAMRRSSLVTLTAEELSTASSLIRT